MREVTFVHRITAHSVSGLMVCRGDDTSRVLFVGKLTCRHAIVDIHGCFNVDDIDDDDESEEEFIM